MLAQGEAQPKASETLGRLVPKCVVYEVIEVPLKS